MYTQTFSSVIAAMLGREIKLQYADSLNTIVHSFHEVNHKFGVNFTPQSVGSSTESVLHTGRPLRAYFEQVKET